MPNSEYPVRNIDIALLRAFAATADTGSMTIAAQMLHRTQGAISQQIARLETLFETQLFDRHPGALRLTQDGERLLVGANRMIAENDKLLALMRGETAEGELRVGMPPDVVSVIATPALRAFRDLHPNVRVTLVSQSTRTLRDMIDRGNVDLALTTDATPSTTNDSLLAGNLVWVGAKGGSAYTLRPIPVALGEEECAFRAATVNALVGAGIDWRSARQIGSLEPVIACLAADTAIGVFLEQTVPTDLVRINHPSLPKLPVAYVNLLLKHSTVDATTADLIECVHDTAQTLAG